MNEIKKNEKIKAGKRCETFRFIGGLISINNVGNLKLTIVIYIPKH